MTLCRDDLLLMTNKEVFLITKTNLDCEESWILLKETMLI
jgi:hypothetical protein